MSEPKPTYQTAAQTCEHNGALVMASHDNFTLLQCDWGCGSVLLVTDATGISHQFTAAELLAIAKERRERETAVSQEVQV